MYSSLKIHRLRKYPNWYGRLVIGSAAQQTILKQLLVPVNTVSCAGS